MARIEWVERRLENWALWKDRESSGGLGFASASIFADGAAARGHGWCGETFIPHDEIEASITDEAVQALRVSHGHLHKTVTLYYLQGQGIKGTARTMGRAESTIHSQLGQVDAFVSRWLEERKKRIEAKGIESVASIALMDSVAMTSPALDKHLEIRERIKQERKAARMANKGKRRRPTEVVTCETTDQVQPTTTEPRIRRRQVLTLKRS